MPKQFSIRYPEDIPNDHFENSLKKAFAEYFHKPENILVFSDNGSSTLYFSKLVSKDDGTWFTKKQVNFIKGFTEGYAWGLLK